MNLREYENNKYLAKCLGIEDKDSVTVISTELDSGNGDRYDGTWFSSTRMTGLRGSRGFYGAASRICVVNGCVCDNRRRRGSIWIILKYCAVNLFCAIRIGRIITGRGGMREFPGSACGFLRHGWKMAFYAEGHGYWAWGGTSAACHRVSFGIIRKRTAGISA